MKRKELNWVIVITVCILGTLLMGDTCEENIISTASGGSTNENQNDAIQIGDLVNSATEEILPTSFRSLYIRPIEYKASVPYFVTNQFIKLLKNEFITNGRLSIADTRQDADGELYVTITEFNNYPLTRTSPANTPDRMYMMFHVHARLMQYDYEGRDEWIRDRDDIIEVATYNLYTFPTTTQQEAAEELITIISSGIRILVVTGFWDRQTERFDSNSVDDISDPWSTWDSGDDMTNY